MLQKVVFSILILTHCLLVWAQLPELKKQNQDVNKEIATLLNESEEGQMHVYNILSLARNYYKIDNYVDAEKHFIQVINDPVCTPLDYKALAICLKQNGKTSLANEFYSAYSKENKNKTFESLWANETKRNKGLTRASVTRLSQYDFIYGSVNPNGSANLNIDYGTVTGNVSCETFINLEAVQFPVESFSRLGSFTNAEKPGCYYYSYQKSNNRYGIFYIQYKKNKWKKPRELDLGELDADYCFPFFVNGKLYVSSNKSGGYGDFDLYQADVNGKEVSSTKNLGPQINTDKNEILPSIYDGMLYFSSNGYPGKGGYDLFYADWSLQRVNTLEYPFNSSEDEFLLIQKDDEKASLFRKSGDKVNLVRVSFFVDYQKVLSGQVVDEASNTVDKARVLFTKSYVDQGIFQTSNSDGSFAVVIPDTVDTWMIECHKDGYEKSSFEVDISTLGNNPLIIVLSLIKPVEPEPVFVMTSKSRNVIPSEPTAVNDSTDQQTRNDSSFNEVNETGRYYVVLASTKSYESAYAVWNKRRKKYPNIEILENEEMHVYRVGIYAGSSYQEALKEYKKAQKIVPDAWILRPDMR